MQQYVVKSLINTFLGSTNISLSYYMTLQTFHCGYFYVLSIQLEAVLHVSCSAGPAIK